MATLRKHGLKYYARIQWRDENASVKEKTVPLKTHLKSEALVRKSEVERYEDDIIKGEDYTVEFKWLNDDCKTKISRRTVQEAIDEYHVVKDIRNQRKSTIERSKCGLKTLTDILGRADLLVLLMMMTLKSGLSNAPKKDIHQILWLVIVLR